MDQNSILGDLLNKARNGDAAARDELFDKCRNYVNIVARAQVESWLQAKVDASDLVQQTLLEAHRGLDGFRGNTEGEWLAWLRKILSNNTTDFIRRYKGAEKRRATKEVPLQMPLGDNSQEFFFDPSADIDSPSQIVMEHEREILLADAIAQLSEDHQEVVMLRNVQKLPFDEVARRMDRTRPAVQMLWMRAIKRLQQILKGQDDV